MLGIVMLLIIFRGLPLGQRLLVGLPILLLGLYGFAAMSLHRRLFPYLRLFEVRRGENGRPTILDLVDGVEQVSE